MPISNDDITKSVSKIMSGIWFIESPFIATTLIILCIIGIFVYSLMDHITDIDTKLIYKVLISLFIGISIIVFLHDTILLSMLKNDTTVLVSSQPTTEIKPNIITTNIPQPIITSPIATENIRGGQNDNSPSFAYDEYNIYGSDIIS